MRFELWKNRRCVAAGEQDAVWAALRLYGPLRHVESEEYGAWHFAHEVEGEPIRFDRDPSRQRRFRRTDFYLTIRPEPVRSFDPERDYPAQIAAREEAERIEATYGGPTWDQPSHGYARNGEIDMASRAYFPIR